MATIGIASYVLRVKEKHKPDYLRLGALRGSKSFNECVREFLKSVYGTQSVDERAQIVLRSTNISEEQAITTGLFLSGEYGYSAEGVNVKTSSKSYQRKADDAEILPFYFLFYVPKESDTAILILQRHGNVGIRTSVLRSLKKYFALFYPDLIIVAERLVPGELVQNLVEGEIRGIKLTTYTVPDDIADKFRWLGNMREEGTLTVSYLAKRDRIFKAPDWLRSARKQKAKLISLPVELNRMKARIQINVRFGGQTRLVDISDPSNVAPYIDATSKLKIMSNGHPDFNSIDKYCRTLLVSLLEEMGLSDEIH